MEKFKMKLVKVGASYNSDLVENPQAIPTKFSFTNKIDDTTFVEVTSRVKCREYFNEFLMKVHHPEEINAPWVYGFKYDHENNHWNKECPSLSMTFPNKQYYDNFLINISLLNNLERSINIPETFPHALKDNTIVIEFNPFWIKKCLVFNIYTQILKLLALPSDKLKTWEDVTSFIVNPFNTPTECSYLNTVGFNNMNILIENLQKIADFPTKYVDGRDSIVSISNIHTNTGICTLMRYTNPSWLKSSTWNLDFVKMLLDLFKQTPTTYFFPQKVAQ